MWGWIGATGAGIVFCIWLVLLPHLIFDLGICCLFKVCFFGFGCVWVCIWRPSVCILLWVCWVVALCVANCVDFISLLRLLCVYVGFSLDLRGILVLVLSLPLWLGSMFWFSWIWRLGLFVSCLDS